MGRAFLDVERSRRQACGDLVERGDDALGEAAGVAVHVHGVG